MKGASVLAALLALVAVARGDIVQDELENDSRSLVLIARPFGFQPLGVLQLQLDNIAVHVREGQPAADKKKLGFFITTAEAAVQIQQQLINQGASHSGA